MDFNEILGTAKGEPAIVNNCIILSYNNYDEIECPEVHSIPTQELLMSKISKVLGEEEIVAIEFLGDGDVILVTVKVPERRDDLLTRVSTISWTRSSNCSCNCVLTLHPLGPLHAYIHLTVSGIPYIILKAQLDHLKLEIEKLLPFLSDVKYEFRTWTGTEIYNGTLAISGVTSNVIESIDEVRKHPKFLVIGGFSSIVKYHEANPVMDKGEELKPPMDSGSFTFEGW